MTGRPTGTLLICNDLAMGRALGRACAAYGLVPPAWVVLREGAARLDAAFNVVILVIAPGDPANRREPALLAEIADVQPVIVVADLGTNPTGHAGMIAPDDGWETRVVELLADHLGVTAALLPTYENRLRVLGRELDLQGYAVVSIVETTEGFQVRPEGPDQERLEVFEFTNRDFGRFVREALVARGEDSWVRPTGRLSSSGHEALLRMLGRDLDRDGATQVQITLLARSLLISGLRAASPYDAPEAFQELLREVHLRDLERRAGYERRAPEGWIARFSKRFGLGS